MELTAAGLPVTLTEPITRESCSAARIIALFQSASARMKNSRTRILKARRFRRRERRMPIPETAQEWLRKRREWIEYMSPERDTLDLNLVNEFSGPEPAYTREPIGTTDTAVEHAELLEHWLQTFKQQKIPWPEIIGKGTEDGEYAQVTLPAPADALAAPDYDDTLSIADYEDLDNKAKKAYKPRGDGRKMVRVDDEGMPKRNPLYDRDARGRAKSDRYYEQQSDTPFERDEGASAKAHKEALEHYLAEHIPINVRLIPALDCAPGFVRGIGRNRFDLAYLVVRTLFETEELMKRGYAWKRMRDRLAVPRGFNSRRMEGAGGQWFLYELYAADYDAHGRCRPYIAYCVGGDATWERGTPRVEGAQDCLLIDLYQEYGIDAPLWSYHGGLEHLDDDPDYRWQPAIWPVLDPLIKREALITSHQYATIRNNLTGYVHTPDSKLPKVALLAANGKELRKPTIPEPGEIVSATGEVKPFAEQAVSQDLLLLEQTYDRDVKLNTPDPATAGGQSGQSGHALVVQSTLRDTAKAQIRAGALDCIESIGEKALRIAIAYYRKHGVELPLYTTLEAPVEGGEPRQERTALALKEVWVGNHYRVKAEYPEEENLARISLEMDLMERGAGSFEDVQKARGKTDTMRERVKVSEDQWWRGEAGQTELITRVAKKRGDKELLKRLGLATEGRMVSPGLPGTGLEQGVPLAAISPDLRQKYGPMLGTRLGGMADRLRGSIVSGEMGTAARTADAQAQMQVGA